MDNLVPHKTNIFDVANNLINKLSAGVGWFFSRNTPEKKALETYINDIENSNYDPLTKAALISNAKKIIKEYSNQHNIVKYATEFLSPSSQAENVDEDWLAMFMDKARLVSDSEFQIIWGKILAGECDNPGSTPKTLLNTLALMDKETAEKFMAIASVSVWYIDDGKKEAFPVIIQEDFDFYISLGITHSSIWEMASLGLLKEDFGFGSQLRVTFDNQCDIRYNEQKYAVMEDSFINFGNVTFTKAGMALYFSVFSKKIDGFFENRCVPYFEKTKGIKSKTSQ